MTTDTDIKTKVAEKLATIQRGEHEQSVIKEVELHDDRWSVLTEDSWGFAWEVSHSDIEPKAGDIIVTYGLMGFPVRGVDINGAEVYFKTDAELAEDRERMLLAIQKRREEQFEKEEAKLNDDFEALPLFFQKRIQRFRDADPEFRVNSEGYEMFTLTEAVKIADHFGTEDEIVAWADMPYEEQKETFEVSSGHSGHTYAMAVAFARAIKQGREDF